MEKNIIIEESTRPMTGLESTVERTEKWLRRPEEWLQKYYSSVCHHPISKHQTHLLLEAQVAFVMAAFGGGSSLLLHGFFALWFLWAVVRCKLALSD